jgi:serine/threonine protein kinase
MLEIGQVIGCYRILRKLGEGGMGAVFEASHDEIARRTAIKVLHPQFAQDPQVAQRFLNEAKAVNQIDHPGIVSIYDVGRLPDGTSFIVMEFLKGETLTARADRRGGRLSVAEALHVLRQVASALSAAHQAGIVHRDLKPDNIMIIRDPLQSSGERIKVLDFGIARLGAEAVGGGDGAAAPRLTRTGSVMGTPIYMSPEQCRGAGRVDGKADVYSLGIILFQLLVGRPPFLAEGMGALMAMHIYESPPALADCLGDSPHVQSLEPILAGLLAKEPQDRPTMAQVLQLLEPLVAASPFVRSAASSETPPDLLRQGTPALLTLPGRRSTLGGAAVGRSSHTLRDRRRSSWVTWLGAVLVVLGANAGVWQLLRRAPSHAATVESAASQRTAAIDVLLPSANRAGTPVPASLAPATDERTSQNPRPPDTAPPEMRPTAAKKPEPAAKRSNGPPRRASKDAGKPRAKKGTSSVSPGAPTSPAKSASPPTDDPPETPDF